MVTNQKRLAVNINEDIHNFTKILAIKNKCTQGEIVEKALVNTYNNEIEEYKNNK